MKTEFAACEYCGQYNTVTVPDNATQEDISMAAISVCNCGEAALYRDKKAQIEKANSRIDELFRDSASKYGFAPVSDEHLMKHLYKTVEMAANGNIMSATVNLGEHGKAKISISESGKISIERVRTVKQKL